MSCPFETSSNENTCKNIRSYRIKTRHRSQSIIILSLLSSSNRCSSPSRSQLEYVWSRHMDAYLYWHWDYQKRYTSHSQSKGSIIEWVFVRSQNFESIIKLQKPWSVTIRSGNNAAYRDRGTFWRLKCKANELIDLSCTHADCWYCIPVFVQRSFIERYSLLL